MKKGFTLIELLIVVAIIAILAAIAVPNFLEAQTRAKIAHELSNMRTNKTALESYRVDNQSYPLDSSNENRSWAHVTTPIGYLATIPLPVFAEYRNGSGARRPGDADATPNFQYSYWGGGNDPDPGDAGNQFVSKNGFAIVSAGPTETRFVRAAPNTASISSADFYDKSVTAPRLKSPNEIGASSMTLSDKLYDPTNGTISFGMIVSTQFGVLNSK